MSALMREADLLRVLAFYAEPANYEPGVLDGEPKLQSLVRTDGGQRARDALAMVEEANR